MAVLCAEGFFDFLFSNRWDDGCLLRVLSGRLLEDLLYVIVQLEKWHDVISCVTIAYVYSWHLLQPCIKTTNDYTPSRDNEHVKKERILIELDYICPQERPDILQRKPKNVPGRPGRFILKNPSCFENSLQFSGAQSHAYSTIISSTEVASSCQPDGSGRLSGSQYKNEEQSGTETGLAKVSVTTLATIFGDEAEDVAKLSEMNTSTEVERKVSSDPFLSEESKERGESVLTTCNIRGLARPAPPHEDCMAPYHMVREPILQRRRRLQSVFPSIRVPPVIKQTKLAHIWGDRWQDDDHLGHVYEGDKSDKVASSTTLVRYSDDNLANSGKTKDKAKFSKQRQAIALAMSREEKTRQQNSKFRKSEKGVKKSERQNRRKSSEPFDDVSSVDGDDSEFELDIDHARVRILERDVSLMNSDLILKEPVLPIKRMNMKTRLKKELRNRKLQTTQTHLSAPPIFKELETPKETSSSKPLTEKKVAKRTVPRQRQKKSDADASTFFQSSNAPLNLMKIWEKCPQFDEFYYYVLGKDQDKIQRLLQKQKAAHFYPEDSDMRNSHDKSTDQRELITHEAFPTLEQTLKDNWKGMKEVETKSPLSCQVDDQKRTEETVALRRDKRRFKPSESKEKKRQNTGDKQSSSFYVPGESGEVLESHQDDHKWQNYSTQPSVMFVARHKPGSIATECLSQSSLTEREQENLSTEADVRTGASQEKFLTKEQERLIKNYSLDINDIDPWHVSVRIGYPLRGKNDTIDMKNDLLRRRERIYRLIKRGKLILQLNGARLWSLTREGPTEQTQKSGFLEERDWPTEREKLLRRQIIHTGSISPDGQEDQKVQQRATGACDDKDVGAASAAYYTNTRHLSSPNEFTKTGVDGMPKKTDLSHNTRKSTAADKEKYSQTNMKPVEENINIVQTQMKQHLVLDESEIPETITEDEVFELMRVNQQFDIGKLKSTYSFENMFAHRSKDVPNYNQRLKKYQHPLTKKKTVEKNPKQKRDKSKTKFLKIEQSIPTPEEGLPTGEQFKPLTVSEKLRNFTFLKHKDHKPCIPQIDKLQCTQFTTDELFDSFLFALQKFVVRKERATLTQPCHSQVSITFTRRPAGLSQFEMPSPTQNDDGRQMAAAAFRALLRHLSETRHHE